MTEFDHGAHYHGCDFQVHSPLDGQWKGLGKADDEAKKDYARSLVAACRARALQAIAITDHHEMGFIPILRQAAVDERGPDGELLPEQERLVVFPGMELTLGVPCQALLIFDADFPQDLFPLVSNALAIQPGEFKRLEHINSLVLLKRELDKHAYLRGRYVVFPNVSDGGNATLLRSGMAGKYAEMPFEGGYVDGAFDKLGKGNRDILAGKTPEHGYRRIAVIQTSDNRNAEHDLLGRYPTWIKWATPTAEALRQACLAQESRISLIEPRLPAVRIESIGVSNSSFLGPIDLAFNQQYSAMIGGRGTGKSSILEYLRWGLCDQPLADDTDGEIPNYQRRRARLITGTLVPVQGKVEVRYSLHDTVHVVRRDSVSNTLEIKIGDAPFKPISEEQVRALLPIQAYSQKQLSDVSVRLDELLRFITTPIKAQLGGIDSRLGEQAAIVRERYSARERKRALDANKAQRELARQSLDQQAAEIRKRLTGLSDEDRKLIDDAPRYQEAERHTAGWSAGLGGAIEVVRQARQRIEQTKSTMRPAPALAEAPELGEISAEVVKALDASLTFLAQAQTGLSQAISHSDDLSGPWAAWRARLADFNARYLAASERSSVHAQRLKELAAIEKQIAEQQGEIDRLAAQISALAEADAQSDSARAQIVALRNTRADLLAERCQELSERSNGLIRARINRGANFAEFIETFQDAVRGSKIRASKFEALAELLSADPLPSHAALLADLEALAVHHDVHGGDAELPPTPFLGQLDFGTADAQRIAGVLTQSSWLRLSLVYPADVPVFEYRAKENDYIAFGNASAGQQATALLSTLLNSEGPPLIVDQPEEDLDNNVIQEIVELIWSAKHKRQIIFASHNANLVVNGDADLVVWCTYRTIGDQSGGKVGGEGAIDVPAIRKAVTDVMEGGEAAFNLRRQKYGF
ncbi:TrlF family AAA-like ATPase [Mesorhizobium sp. CA4]|uniref:TrlF family AAA-like ATPase n=1 Tax=Mesorhizobium sp. CA4 TaxID=588499 RepID=UPI001CD0AA87|nr:AAA family ATPase [Mesorhizobium sp. CA4]MBZ9823210.1 AAA family ATPase [Mesorhizobium sp. CA4]